MVILCRILAIRPFKSGIIGAVDKIHHFSHKNWKNHHPCQGGDGSVTVGESRTVLIGKDVLSRVSSGSWSGLSDILFTNTQNPRRCPSVENPDLGAKTGVLFLFQ